MNSIPSRISENEYGMSKIKLGIDKKKCGKEKAPIPTRNFKNKIEPSSPFSRARNSKVL